MEAPKAESCWLWWSILILLEVSIREIDKVFLSLISLCVWKLCWMLNGEIKMALIFILQTLKLQKEVIFWMSWTWLTFIYVYIELSCCLIRKLQLIFNEFSSWQNVGNANRINLKSKKWFYYLWRFKNSGTIVPFNPSLFGLCIMTVGILYCFTLLLWGLVKLPLGDFIWVDFAGMGNGCGVSCWDWCSGELDRHTGRYPK